MKNVVKCVTDASESFRVAMRATVIICLTPIAGSAQTHIGPSQIPNFAWVTPIGGESFDQASAVAVSQNNDVFAAGWFVGNVTIGQSAFANNSKHQAFLCKLNAAGQIQWAKQAGGSGDDNADCLAVSPDDKIFVGGLFQNTASFATGVSVISAGFNDAFLSRYDSSGQFIWVKRDGGVNGDSALGVALDSSGGLFRTGTFQGTASFGNFTFTSAGGNDIYVDKHDLDGATQWVKHFGGVGSDWGFSSAVDKVGSVYVVGQFANSVAFGNTTLVSRGGLDAFLVKLDSSGNVLWAKQSGGLGDDFAGGVSIGGHGEVFVCGKFNGTALFEAQSVNSAGGADLFCARYDNQGSIQWVKAFGGVADEGKNALRAAAVTTDSYGNCYLGCNFSGTIYFGNFQLTSLGGTDIAFLKLSANGDVVWAKQSGGPLDDWVNSVAMDRNGALLAAGVFQSTATFDTLSVISTGQWDGFVTKLQAVEPRLSVVRHDGQIILSWPSALNEFHLEYSTTLTQGTWSVVPSIKTEGEINTYDAAPTDVSFYRLTAGN